MKPESILPIAFDSRWIGENGIGRFAKEVSSRIKFSHHITHNSNPAKFTSPLILEYWLKSNKISRLFSPGFIPPLSKNLDFSFTIHDLNHIDITDNSSTLKKIFYRSIIKPAINNANFVFTVSEYSKNRIIEWSNCNEDKVIVVGNGVSSSFRPDTTSRPIDKPYIFCCSNRKTHKNETRLLKAYKSSGIQKDIKLVLSGTANQEIQNEIRSLHLEQHVMFAGRVSEEYLAAWYAGAIFSIFPSFYEGFGLPVIESMACGTPVITSNVTSMPEIGGSAALYIDPYRIESIQAAILKLSHDNALQASMREAGLLQAKKFSWDSTAANIFSHLNKTSETYQ